MTNDIYVIIRFDPCDNCKSNMCYVKTEQEAINLTRKYNLEGAKEIKLTAQGDVIESDENFEAMTMISCDEPIWYEYDKVPEYDPNK